MSLYFVQYHSWNWSKRYSWEGC